MDKGLRRSAGRRAAPSPPTLYGKIAPVIAQDIIPESLCLLFGVVSFGYMCAWTSLGSLISYYKAHYGPSLYNRIYCAYYLPGLPVALLQHKYDNAIDRALGSRNAYMARGVVSLNTVVFAILSLVWVTNEIALIFLFALLGTCSWLIHGTSSMLAAMYPSRSIGYLQTGFRTPEVFTVIVLQCLDIGKYPKPSNLGLFYTLVALMVWVGLCAWMALVTSKVSRGFFDDLDASLANDLGSGGITSDPSAQQYSMDTNYPQVVVQSGQEQEQDWAESDDETCVGDEEDDCGGGGTPGVRLRLYPKYETGAVESSPLLGANGSRSGGRGRGRGGSQIFLNTSFYGTPLRSDSAGAASASAASPSRNKLKRESELWLEHLGRVEDISISVDELDGGPGVDDALGEEGGGGGWDWDDTAALLGKASRGTSLKNGAVAGPSTLPGHRPFSHQDVQAVVRPLCWALFLTMTTSIFQASFFSYAESTGGRNIEQILYFTRLFCDLFGRPLATMAARPWFVKTPQLVLICSIYRLVLFGIFFAYLFVPGFVQSDVLINVIVGAFSLVNGYFSVLIYEYASDAVASKGRTAQAYATTLLNIVFQGSAFLAVCCSTVFLLIVPVPVHAQ